MLAFSFFVHGNQKKEVIDFLTGHNDYLGPNPPYSRINSFELWENDSCDLRAKQTSVQYHTKGGSWHVFGYLVNDNELELVNSLLKDEFDLTDVRLEIVKEKLPDFEFYLSYKDMIRSSTYGPSLLTF